MDGVTIGQYRITGMIGRGGMGVVYAAEHTLLGRPAAIKVLLPDLSQKQEIVQRFFNEARAATAIRHPGIVEVYDFGWTPDGAAFIVMEKLDGETLAKRVGRGLFRWQLALSVARQITGALGAAHAKGIVHRDLKPDNVYLVRDPEVPGGERIKLLDFGIAKLAGDTAPGSSVTTTGAVMGTPTYMSPEQCRGVAVDHRADLYALGCVVFELCCGRPPFVGEGAGDVLGAHIYMTPPSLASCGAAVPQAVEQLVQRMLAKPPGDRIQTAEELIRAIDGVMTDAGWAAAMISVTPTPSATSLPAMTTLSGSASTHASVVRPGNGRRRGVAVGAGVAIALATASVVLATRGPSVPVVRAPEAAPVASGSAGPASERVAAAAPVNVAPATVEPTKSAPATVEPAVAEPVKAEPAVVAPANAAPANAALAKTEPAKTEPAKTEPAKTEPAKTEPAKTEPAKTEPKAAAAPVVRATTISVSVDSVPAGADVVVAGKSLGKTPYRGSLSQRADNITLTVRLSGYSDRSITVRGDRAINQSVTLTKPKSTSSNRDRRDESVNPF